MLSYSKPKVFDQSEYVWVENLPPGRNQFVSFVREIKGEPGEKATIHLFADTRFRLYVNEVFTAYGPARFVTQFAEYDSFEIGPLLRKGMNTVRVEVNFYGTSSFQSMPDGKPGFIAAGETEQGGRSFKTPGQWQAIVHDAWDTNAPLFSFAQNPAEVVDLRTLNRELTAPVYRKVIPLPPGDIPWNLLRPRSAPYPDYHLQEPAKSLLAAPSAVKRHLIGYQSNDPRYFTAKLEGKNPREGHRQIAAWIYAEADREVTFESFWSEVELNGEGVKGNEDTLPGNHWEMVFPLRAGWNFYAANVQQLSENWSHLLAWPPDAGLSLHALPDRKTPEPWAVSPLGKGERIIPSPPASPEDYGLPEGWTLDSGDPRRITPARQMAWDLPDSDPAVRDRPYTEREGLCTLRCATGIWSFDFQDQFYGQPMIEVEAPAGSVLDVAYDDWKREDGCVKLYGANPFTDAADRFILRGGRQILDVLNPRGGIFIQCVLRTPDGEPADLSLHGVGIRSRQVLRQEKQPGQFACGDPVLDWAWATSARTVTASTDEGYADCPWRERGSYIGDSFVNLHLHRLVTSDFSVAFRTIRLMGEGQHPDGPRKGQLASVTPAWHRVGLEDFTLIWILCLRDYWRYTGDSSLLKESWERVMRIWESPVWHLNKIGLWDLPANHHAFVDWGCDRRDKRTLESNLLINLFRLGAARAASEIAGVLNHQVERERFDREARQVKAAVETHLWREEQGRFAPGDQGDSPCLHGQVLALCFGAGDPEKILKTIEPELRNNFNKGVKEGQHSGHLELYFHSYLLPALAELGRTDLAEDFIQDHFSFLKSLGYPTLNECFCRAARGYGSCCHSWSGAPAIYATANILGLRQAEYGNPDKWRLSPRTNRHDRVSGAMPHADGLIEVTWTRKDGFFRARVRAPASVEILTPENVILE